MRRTLGGLMSAPPVPFSEYAPTVATIKADSPNHRATAKRTRVATSKSLPSASSSEFVFRGGRRRIPFRARTNQRASSSHGGGSLPRSRRHQLSEHCCVLLPDRLPTR